MAGGVEHSHQFRLFYGATDLQSEINESADRQWLNTSGHTEYSATPNEFGNIDYSDFDEESMDELWARKTAESKGSSNSRSAGVYESIQEHGYDSKRPVTLDFHETEDSWGGPQISLPDAHHRVAAAADIERTTGKDVWIPVSNRDEELPYRHKQQLRRAGLR